MKLLPNIKRKLISLRKRVDKEVEGNFGYCPDSPVFDKLIDEMREYENQIKERDVGWYKRYCEEHY